MNKTPFIVSVFTFLILAVSTTAASRPLQDKDCGRAVNGLQMCLGLSGSDLELAFRNAGDRDLVLNLGIMLGNGKVQSPSRVAMKFTDAQGKTRVFQFSDKRYSNIGGRVDDYVVPLRIGSTYTFELTLDQFWCLDTTEFSIPLLSGDNLLTAQFEGSGAREVTSDMPGIKLMNFWVGTVESNTLTLRR